MTNRSFPIDHRLVTAADWISAHLCYHTELDDVVLNVVKPLTAELASTGVATDWFFLRYWDGSPQLRLHILPRMSEQAEQVRALVTHHAENYSRQKPDRQITELAEDGRLALNFAHDERVAHSTTTSRRKNAISFVPYYRERARFGDGESARAVERHFAESSRIALSLLSNGTETRQRDSVAYSMILLTWWCAAPSAFRLARWLFVAARLWQSTTVDGSSADELDAQYRRQRQSLMVLAERMRALARHPLLVTGRGTMSMWGSSVTRLRNVLTEQIVAGQFRPPTQAFGGNPGMRHPTARERAVPVLDTCAHLVCNRLGLTVTREYYLRGLAARAIIDIAKQGRADPGS